ncbi:conserved hypothetical protein [Capnocytophaga canimorsus]|uniref:Uncharacterized protein n=1 Tax=Capnocytophaga canimorsus TaxID=28188 RepID=A0A0B7H117_9FLAO|nr:hypothetical protein [Capnocytophaga canimorsus]ATA76371.1 DNA topoisomerase IV [Capnocytophaga canimorsus]PJI79586.1 hypothetical protein CLV61_1472 [Capnocytophaga canimorsus]CEN33226.1 conserved hypothetical protein [Capnocytophaga canimorsus]CEN46238.1 conserved hypothetical protein [Capnocytophaga canimorsus]STA71511.1 Uncharacterised protein [Capnocytophaga canimorsus]
MRDLKIKFTFVKSVLFTFVIVFFVGCFTPERKCSDFKTGQFHFETEINGKTEETFFVRKDSIEIDFYKGKADTATIRWVNDCEYILTKLNPKNNQEKKPIHIKILTTDANGYTFEFSVLGNAKQKQRGYAKVIATPPTDYK